MCKSFEAHLGNLIILFNITVYNRRRVLNINNITTNMWIMNDVGLQIDFHSASMWISLFIDQSIYPSSEGLSFIWMKSIGNQIILSDGLDSFPVACIPMAIGAICININISSYTRRPILHPALHAPRLSCVCLILLWGTIKLLLLLLVFDQSSLLFNSLPVLLGGSLSSSPYFVVGICGGINCAAID